MPRQPVKPYNLLRYQTSETAAHIGIHVCVPMANSHIHSIAIVLILVAPPTNYKAKRQPRKSNHN